MTTALDLLPYAEDGVRNHPVSLEIRVPIVNSPTHRWCYITAVFVGTCGGWEGTIPTDEELRMVGSFHESYCSHWYGPPHTGWRGRDMDKRPFDIDAGANGVTFIRYEHGGWGYRRRSWSSGPLFVPMPRDDPASLLAVMDRCNDGMSRWSAWKADHPDIFGVSDEDRAAIVEDTKAERKADELSGWSE